MTTPFLLERRQVVPGSLPQVFRFFKDPANLALITPPWLRFRVRASSTLEVEVGTRIRYSIRWLGIPMPWESLIAEYVEGERFADQMLVGPYRSWYHLHTFRDLGGRVEVGDRVEYRLPFGPAGRVAHRLLVRRQLEAIFDYRMRRLDELLVEAGGPEAMSRPPEPVMVWSG